MKGTEWMQVLLSSMHQNKKHSCPNSLAILSRSQHRIQKALSEWLEGFGILIHTLHAHPEISTDASGC